MISSVTKKAHLMKPSVESWNFSIEGEFSEKKLRQKLEQQGYSVSCYTYSPGTYFPDHVHSVDKADAVVSGTFEITLPGGKVILKAGDCIKVPRGTVHAARVIGNEPVVSLDGIL